MTGLGIALSSIEKRSHRDDKQQKVLEPSNLLPTYERISINAVHHKYLDHAFDTEEDAKREMKRLDEEAQSSGCDDNSGKNSCNAGERGRQSSQRRGPRGGVYDPFPIKLHRMLESVEAEGLDSIVSWLSHGRAFAVHKPKDFVDEVIPRYFRQTKITSFQRQLNLYGFVRLTRGLDAGAYYHELCLRGKSFLCKLMLRTKVKGNGNQPKTPGVTEIEPNFYKMRPLPASGQDEESTQETETSSLVEDTGSTIQNRFCSEQPERIASSIRDVVQAALSEPGKKPHQVSSKKSEETDFEIPAEVVEVFGRTFNRMSISRMGPTTRTRTRRISMCCKCKACHKFLPSRVAVPPGVPPERKETAEFFPFETLSSPGLFAVGVGVGAGNSDFMKSQPADVEVKAVEVPQVSKGDSKAGPPQYCTTASHISRSLNHATFTNVL